MRRVFSVAIPGFLAILSLALFAPAALAQHGGGGHGGGGGHAGGFGGGHAGGFGGGGFSHAGGFSGSYSGRSFGGSFSRSAPAPMSSFAPRSYGYSYAPRAGASAYRSPYRSGYQGMRSPNYASSWGVARSGGNNHDRGRDRSRYRGYGYGYPFLGNSWEVLPWDLGYPDFAGYDDGEDYGDNYASAQPQDDLGPVYAAPAPDEEPRPAYGDPYPPASEPASAPVRNEPSFALIFNDGHQQSIRNYALTSNYILVLDDDSRQQRIPLSELNLPATESAAQQAGIDFTPPA